MTLEEDISPFEYDKAYKTILKAESEGLNEAFKNARKVLCVQPHPDDNDLAAGGLVAKLSEQGCKVTYVTMTDGEMGTLNPKMRPEELATIRRTEQKEAAKILGVKNLIWLNYRDSELKSTIEARNKLISVIRKFRPNVILTVDPWLTYEAHPDHIATGFLAAEAAFFATLPHANSDDMKNGLEPHTVGFIAFYWTRKPNIYVDITDHMKIKLKAVASHKSQFPPESFKKLEDTLKAYFRLMGKKIGVKYAEAFKVLSLRHLHCCTYAEDL